MFWLLCDLSTACGLLCRISKLTQTTAAYNSTFYSAIKMTPFQAFRGRLPLQISLIHAPENETEENEEDDDDNHESTKNETNYRL
jgi:hypothetical protein